jgi:hypothetical protein
VARLPDSLETIEKMSWDEMQALFASIFVDEITDVQERGGEALVREKLALLSDGQGKFLRRALAEPA